MVLGHSRLLWLRFYRQQTTAVLIEGLESAFARFGEVPAELLFDQMRAVVLSDDRSGGGELVMNAEFLHFAAHWGFMPRSCRPYRAQTKGGAEGDIKYVKRNFLPLFREAEKERRRDTPDAGELAPTAAASVDASVRCSCGTAPSSHKAFWQPPLKATKLSPPSTTSAYSKPE